MGETTQTPGTEPANQIDAAKVTPSTTTFGFSAISLPTPKWAAAAFDMYLILYTAFLAWIVADSVFDKELTQHIFYFLTLFLTPVIKGVSKMFGVAVDAK